MADTSYVIDIAASMPEGGATTAQLDELSQSLIRAGGSAETLEAATMSVAAQLRAARDATQAANAALAEGNARYSELEKAAVKAAKAAESAALKGKLDPAMSKAAHDAATALEAEGRALRRLEGEAAAAARAEARLVNTQANLGRISRSASTVLSEQAAAAKKSIKEAEKIAPLTKTYADWSDALSTSGGRAIIAVGAVAGLTTAVLALTAAAAAGTLAIAAWGVGLADAKRDAQIARSAVEAMHPELAALSGTIDALADRASVPELQDFARKLKDAKVSAEDMPAALEAVANAQALLGKGGADELVAEFKAGKKAARALSKEVNDKLGGLVEARLQGLGAQSAKLKKNVGELFSGLNIEPVLDGFRVLVDLFDQNTASGQAMKLLFEEVFQPLIDQARNAAYVVEAFVLGFLIGLTKLYIALKPAIKTIAEFFGFEDTSLSDILAIATKAGEYAAFVFAGFVATLAAIGVVVGVVIAAIVGIQVAIYAMIAALVAAVVYVDTMFINAFIAVKNYLTNLGSEMVQLGTNLIMGLVQGIKNSANAVVSAVTGAVGGAIDAAKRTLGIASPSKVFAEIGGHTADGFAQGVDDGTADAQAAMSAMVEPPDAGSISPYTAAATADRVQRAPGGGGAGGAARAGRPSVQFNAPVYFGGKQATPAEVEDLVELITKTLEGDAAAVAGEGADAA